MIFSEIYNTDETDILSEMAYSKQEISNKLMDISLPILSHIIKVLRYDDVQNYDKHIGDMDRNWFNKIKYPNMKIKTHKGAKPLSEELYFHHLFSGRIDDISDVVRICNELDNKGYSDYQILMSHEEIFDKLKFVMTEVSKELSEGIFNSIRDYL